MSLDAYALALSNCRVNAAILEADRTILCVADEEPDSTLLWRCIKELWRHAMLNALGRVRRVGRSSRGSTHLT